MSKKPSFYNQSLERALGILGSFTRDRQRLSLGQLSESLGLPKSTTFRLCSTLTEFDFLEYDSDAKRYSLGMKLFELGWIVSYSISLRRIASPFLDRLHSKLGKTVFLGVLRDGELLFIDKKEDDRNHIRFSSDIGRRRAPHFGCLGQVLLAHLKTGELDRILKQIPLTSFTQKTITDPQLFRETLKKIRSQGYALDEGGAINGISGIAAPIRDFSGKVVAAVGVGFISSAVDKKGVTEIRDEVPATAKDISLRLGDLGVSQESTSKNDQDL